MFSWIGSSQSKMKEGFIFLCDNCNDVLINLSVEESLSSNVVRLVDNDTSPNHYVFRCPVCKEDVMIPVWVSYALEYLRQKRHPKH